MGFVMAGLDSDSYDRQYGDLELVRRILRYFRPQVRAMCVAAVAILALSASEALVPLFVSRSIDLVAESPRLGGVLGLSAAVLALQSLGWALNFVRQTRAARAIGDVVLQLRRDAFAAVVAHDLPFYDEQPSGKIVARVTSDTHDFATTVDLTMNLASQVLAVALVTAICLSISVRLTLIQLATTPLVVLIALSFRRIARRTTQNARRVLAQVNANIQESVSGIAVAKAFRQERTLYREFGELNRDAYRLGLARGLTLNTIFPVLNGTQGIALAVVLYFGGASALDGLLAQAGVLPAGSVSVGEWFLFIQAMNYYWFPITSIASFWSQFQDGLSAAERVFALMDAEPQVVQRDHRPVPRLQGEVAFRHVRLTYTGVDVVLPDLSLTIAPGETVALVGHTGSGKTSIARLLARFYEFQDGEIRVDGLDIRTLDLAAYRRQLGVVPQVPFLFSGTVRDNIRYGRPEADDGAVEEAARQVAGGDWLLDLADGLDTDVGERGASLSMGQRQLVALARVMLHDPAILILDEATASVDPFTEAQIQEGLERAMAQRTALVIAHRLSTVIQCDRILVMRDGRIIEEGRHRALLAQGGHYAELYNAYFRHQSATYVEEARHLAH